MTTAIHTPELESAAPGAISSAAVSVEIGAIPIRLQPDNPDFCTLLKQRYEGFVNPHSEPTCHFDIHLDSTGRPSDEDARVFRRGNLWSLQRGDFRAEWNPRTARGWIRQCPNPYSIDTVLRITHSLVLGEQGGFLVHAASAIRSGSAYLFAGVSGAGKTTMSRLAPPDATVLTDEISYIRKFGSRIVLTAHHSPANSLAPAPTRQLRSARSICSCKGRKFDSNAFRRPMPHVR
jgi:hypothetical protein